MYKNSYSCFCCMHWVHFLFVLSFLVLGFLFQSSHLCQIMQALVSVHYSVFLAHASVSWVFPSVAFLIHPTFPSLFILFFLCLHTGMWIWGHTAGERKGIFPLWSISSLHRSLCSIISGFSFPFLCLSNPSFSKYLQFLVKPLLVVYWSVIAGSLVL